MKNSLRVALAVLFVWLMWNHEVKSQERFPWQVGVFGGISPTLGTYHGDTAQANLGYVGGFFADHYFGGGDFGAGIDVRMIQHPLWGGDSVLFRNGYTATTYHNAKRFQHMGLAVGPTYRFRTGKFELELFAKGGILFQQFPNYTRELVYETADVRGGMMTQSVVIRRTANSADKALAWMGVGGLRLNYEVARNLSVFVQGDYLSTFGTRFGGKPSVFFIEELPIIQPLTEGHFVENPYEFFAEKPEIRRTFAQAVNIAAGIKYAFGRKRDSKPLVAPPPAEVVALKPKQEESKDIVVVVKDKQTGLALSGVKVTVEGAGIEHTSTTNANGETERLVAVANGTYHVSGEKNGIEATIATITPVDFERAGQTIYKELLHDDPRFTLVGETVECETEQYMSGINTMLTNETTAANISQVSDLEGKFIFQLEQQSAYNVVANQSGKYSQTERVSTVGLDRSKTLYVTLKLGVCALEQGVSWIVKNILYDFDKSDIRHDAALVLDNVVNVLRQNPTLRIELSSHTDSRGNDAYNLRLSQRRAEAAVNYLVSKGISRDRMVARGYGETRLINACANGVDCSEEDHEQNRRTEINVLSY
ncbi:OmpA family protein [Parapedobacter pyrenivorans]|uniref:OmpA family protein n=1 Tax=Parapedobacter pyrenivorans TaxID=1305674 RepID=UPI00334051CA